MTTSNQPEKRLIASTGIKLAKQKTLGSAPEIETTDDKTVCCSSPSCLRHLIEVTEHFSCLQKGDVDNLSTPCG